MPNFVASLETSRDEGSAWRPYGARRWAGYGYPFGAMPTREQEIDFLKDEAQALRRNLEGIDARIKELAGEGK